MSIKGIDVSHYNGNIDWTSVKNSGHDFVIIKTTQGLNIIDNNFRRNIIGAKAAGLIAGAYHFYNPLDDGIDQAIHFLNQLVDTDFPLLIALDVEQANGWDSLTLQQIQDEVMNKFLDTVQTATRCKPLIYTNPAFANQYLKEIPLGTYPLWLSDYNKTIPAGWTNYKIWQSTGNGKIPGINGNVDLNEFNGDDMSGLLARGPLVIPTS